MSSISRFCVRRSLPEFIKCSRRFLMMLLSFLQPLGVLLQLFPIRLELYSPGCAIGLGAFRLLQLPLPVLEFAVGGFELQVVAHHLVKLIPSLRKFFLIDAVLAALLQPSKPFCRRGQLLERLPHLRLLLLLRAETLFELADVIKRVLVCAARLTPGRSHQFVLLLLYYVRQLSATASS